MGAVPSTPRWTTSGEQGTAEDLIDTLVGDKSVPVSSDFWQKLLELPLGFSSHTQRVRDACELFAENNYHTRHLAKILVHLAWCLQECTSTSGASPMAFRKAANAVYISSIFLKYLIENSKNERIEELYLVLDDRELLPEDTMRDEKIEDLVVHAVLSFIGSVDLSADTYLLHMELLNFMLVAMSTQLLSGPSPGPKDVNPFIDAAIAQENSLVVIVMRRLLLNYITQPSSAWNIPMNSVFFEGHVSVVLQKIGSAAANLVLLPFSYLINSIGVGSKSPLAYCSLHVLLILIHYRKCIAGNKSITEISGDGATLDSSTNDKAQFSYNPYHDALKKATNIGFDRVDTEGNARGAVVRLPFALLFDTLGMCLADEAAVLLLYSLLQGNSDFLEYVLVRTDLDTLLMPILEALYTDSRRSSNQIYMLLIILLILSQDSSFNASIHKLMVPGVPWYKERFLQQISLGSLMVIILIKTVQHNLSKQQDIYLHTTSLATLANMAPHLHRLSGYASQRLVSLFYMLSRKYAKLGENSDNKAPMTKDSSIEVNDLSDDKSTEIHIFTDFLRLALEILNAILTYALPQNPEVIYAIMHRQEVFRPFKNHPRFRELLENIFTVLDFFNSRMDTENTGRELSVREVQHIIINNCRSWRGEGLKMFTQLRFTYEQENHPEEFFIPYVWQLVLPRCGFTFNSGAINLFPTDLPVEERDDGEVVRGAQPDSEHQRLAFYLDP